MLVFTILILYMHDFKVVISILPFFRCLFTVLSLHVSMCGDVVLGQQYLKNVWVCCISRG